MRWPEFSIARGSRSGQYHLSLLLLLLRFFQFNDGPIWFPQLHVRHSSDRALRVCFVTACGCSLYVEATQSH